MRTTPTVVPRLFTAVTEYTDSSISATGVPSIAPEAESNAKPSGSACSLDSSKWSTTPLTSGAPVLTAVFMTNTKPSLVNASWLGLRSVQCSVSTLPHWPWEHLRYA